METLWGWTKQEWAAAHSLHPHLQVSLLGARALKGLAADVNLAALDVEPDTEFTNELFKDAEKRPEFWTEA